MSGECDECSEHTLECQCSTYKRGWISVEDKLPVDGQMIAVCIRCPFLPSLPK